MSDINNLIATHTLPEIKEYIMENNFIDDINIKGITVSNISKIFEAMGTGKSTADIESETLITNIQNGVADLNDMKNFLENNIKDCQSALEKVKNALSSVNVLSTEIKNTPGFIKILEYLTSQTQKTIEQQKQFQVLLEYINNGSLPQ